MLRRLEAYLVEDGEPAWVDPAPAEPSSPPDEASIPPVAAPALPVAASIPPVEPRPEQEVVVVGEPTPNPAAMKFATNISIVARGTRSYASREAANGDPVASALFALGGVQSVFAVHDFVTVTKAEGADWQTLKPRIESTLRAVLQARP